MAISSLIMNPAVIPQRATYQRVHSYCLFHIEFIEKIYVEG